MAKTQTQIGIRVTNDFKARLERQADKERRSVSNLILKIEKHFLGMWSKNVYNAAERAKSAIISSKSSNTLHRTLNFTPSLHQMKKTSDVVFKFLTNRKK